MNDWVYADAPSNIALIKYMGKTGESGNAPANSSLSFTLDHLRSRVRLKFERGLPGGKIWKPLIESGVFTPTLSESGQARFLNHAERCLSRLRGSRTDINAHLISQTLVVESANGFPSDCGLASSASSFAALTLACASLVGFASNTAGGRKILADLSREGSGSSCRSLFSPWALWVSSGAEPIDGFPLAKNIRHLAIVVDENKKSVSSSDAHRRVTSSMLFRGRAERAEERLSQVIENLRRSAVGPFDSESVRAWNRAARIVWAESWDMHALFETSDPPFGYFVPGSVYALNCIRDITNEIHLAVGDDKFRQPIVTMDAGPNVHVLLWTAPGPGGFRDELADAFVANLRARLGSSIQVIDSKADVTITGAS